MKSNFTKFYSFQLLISAVQPRWYGKRFLDFMFKTIKYNDCSSKEQAEQAEQIKTENIEV